MAKPWGRPVTSCPSCNQPLGDEHPYQWCAECGKPLPKDILAQIPRQVELAQRGSVVAGPAIAVAPRESTNQVSRANTHSYLANLRSLTCYPAFRGFIDFFTVFGYVVAAIIPLSGLFSGNSAVVFFSIVAGAIVALLVKVSAEASLMIADIADATIESSSRSAGSP